MSSTSSSSGSNQCTLIGDPTDDAVQVILGFIALSSLYGKWHFESPRRPALIWFMDAMKQGTSAAMIHVLNIVCSIGIADYGDKPADADEVRVGPNVCVRPLDKGYVALRADKRTHSLVSLVSYCRACSARSIS